MDNLDELLIEEARNSEFQYAQASKSKRLANLLIDSLTYYLLSLLVGVLLGVFLVVTGNEELLNTYANQEPSLGSTLFEYLIGAILITAYFICMEHFFRGKTIGKLITNSRAINADGSKMNLNTVVKRSLCRLVPFEAFSFLGDTGTGFHDNYSKTIVVDENRPLRMNGSSQPAWRKQR